MPSFSDNKEREWEIKIDAILIDKIREDLDPKFLLNDSDQDNTSNRLSRDPVLLCHVVYALCEKQRNQLGVSLDEFYGEVIGDGEAIEAAGRAVAKAIGNFISPQRRALGEAVAAKEQEVEKLGTEMVLARLNDPALSLAVMANLDALIDEAINKTLMGQRSATSSPDLSASTQPD